MMIKPKILGFLSPMALAPLIFASVIHLQITNYICIFLFLFIFLGDLQKLNFIRIMKSWKVFYYGNRKVVSARSSLIKRNKNYENLINAK